MLLRLGVTEVLSGDVPLAKALHTTGIYNIALLTAGTIFPRARPNCSAPDSTRELTIFKDGALATDFK